MSDVPEDISLAPKSPWGWFPIVLSSFLGTFVAAGIIVGLNWRKMEKDNLVWPTIIFSTIGWVVVQEYWNVLFIDPSISTISGYLLNIMVAIALWYWQRGTYLIWKSRNPVTQTSGWLVPLAAIILSTALYLFLAGL
jgi:hypothetical protein